MFNFPCIGVQEQILTQSIYNVIVQSFNYDITIALRMMDV